MDHGVAMYDVIISDLTEQAYKKVGRIKRFYSKYIARQRLEHEEEVSQLQLRIQKLEAQAHESLLYRPAQPIESPQTEETTRKRRPKVSINIPEEVEDESPASPLVSTSPKATSPKATSPKAVASASPAATKNLHSFVLTRLETERNLARHQIEQLQDTLSSTQEELQQAQLTIQELTRQLLAKETEQLGSEQHAVKQLQALLKELKPS
eukprot:gene39127-47604_t